MVGVADGPGNADGLGIAVGGTGVAVGGGGAATGFPHPDSSRGKASTPMSSDIMRTRRGCKCHF